MSLFQTAFEIVIRSMERQKSLPVPETFQNIPVQDFWNGTSMLFNVCGHFLHFRLERSTHKGASLGHPFVGWNDFLRFLRG